jgi:hypothetical protein
MRTTLCTAQKNSDSIGYTVTSLISLIFFYFFALRIGNTIGNTDAKATRTTAAAATDDGVGVRGWRAAMRPRATD